MQNSPNVNRREFLGSSAASAARVAAGLVSLGIPASGASAEALQVAVIGVGQQGRELAGLLASRPDVRVVSICDVDTTSIGRTLEHLDTVTSHRPDVATNHELVLERQDIDAVVIATPDHWHENIAVEACRAGKDIYLEQPLGLTLEASHNIRLAADESQRIIQCGLPQRSGEHFRSAIELVQSGELGTIKLAKAWAVHKRKSIASCATSSPPPGVDYDRWLGPAPKRQFQANRFHAHWPWFWDYGAGELGLWGVQLLDVVRWGLKLDHPSRVCASGGKNYFRDDRETPDTMTVQYDFGNVTVLWEHRQWSRHGIEGRTAAAAFYGDKGTLIVDRSGWKVYDTSRPLFAPASEIRQAHLTDFIDAVRVRKSPSAPVAEGQRSTAMCHYGNISWKAGREIHIDQATGNVQLPASSSPGI